MAPAEKEHTSLSATHRRADKWRVGGAGGTGAAAWDPCREEAAQGGMAALQRQCGPSYWCNGAE